MPEGGLRARHLLRASFGAGAATLWSAALGLFTTPFMILHLGVARYGVFAVIGVVSSYLSNLEFGFGHATIRFLSRAKAAADEREEAAVIGNSLLIFLPASVGAALLAFLGAPFVATHFLHGSGSLHHTFVMAVRLGAPIIGLSMLSSFSMTCLQAAGEFRLLIGSGWLGGTVLSVGAVTVAGLGGGLLGVLALQLVFNICMATFLFVVAARSTKARMLPRLDKPTLKAMASYAGLLLIAGLAVQTTVQGPSAVLAGFRTTTQVAAFAVPAIIFQQLTSIVGASSLGFLPLASAASATSDHEHLRTIYLANLRLTLLVMTPVLAFLAVFAHPLLATWINNSFADRAAPALAIITVATLMLGLSAAPNDVARGFGKAGWVTAFSLIAAVITLGTAFLLVRAEGAAGAATALAAGLSVATLPFVVLVASRLLGVTPRALTAALWRPLIALAITLALEFGSYRLAPTFAGAVATGAVVTIAYLGGVFLLVFDERERGVLRAFMRRG